MAQAEGAGQAQHQIDISTLNIEQLELLKNDMEEEIQQASVQFSQLRSLIERFAGAKAALEVATKPENLGKPMLVPVTGSVFAAGQVSAIDKVLVDIGTGFVVERTPKEADSYYVRKIKMLEETAEKVAQLLHLRKRQLEQIIAIRSQKVAEQPLQSADKSDDRPGQS